MKIKILGSGGCVALPLPTCECKVCNEARNKGMIITHIKEDWGKSYTDYIKLEEKCRKNNIKFAYDGMKISL